MAVLARVLRLAILFVALGGTLVGHWLMLQRAALARQCPPLQLDRRGERQQGQPAATPTLTAARAAAAQIDSTVLVPLSLGRQCLQHHGASLHLGRCASHQRNTSSLHWQLLGLGPRLASLPDGERRVLLQATPPPVPANATASPASLRPPPNSCLQRRGTAAVELAACRPNTMSAEAAGQLWRWRETVPGRVAVVASASGSLCLTYLGPDKEIALAPCHNWQAAQRVSEDCRQLWWLTDARTRGRPLSRPLPPPPPTRGPRLLCWTMTSPASLHTRAALVNSTWGRQCHHLLFMAPSPLAGLDTVQLPLPAAEDRNMLWDKAQLAWMYLFDHYLDKADWFLRADDDSFVMMDNLYAFLQQYRSTDIHFLGRTLRAEPDHALYYSGGAGNILSRAALKKMGSTVRAGRPNEFFTPGHTFADDTELGVSLAKMNISVEDTRDADGRERFFPLSITLERTIDRAKEPAHWFWNYSYYPARQGFDCCSRRWLVSHYIDRDDMYLYSDRHAAGCEARGCDPPFLQ